MTASLKEKIVSGLREKKQGRANITPAQSSTSLADEPSASTEL